MATSQPGACEFDRLFNKSVPNILEKVFFSLDLDSFTACREVCVTWKELFSTARFCKKAKEMELEMKKLLVAAGEGKWKLENLRHETEHFLKKMEFVKYYEWRQN